MFPKPILELWASQYFQYSFTKTTHQNHTHNGNMGEPIMEIWASQNFQYGFTKTTHHRWAHFGNLGEPIFPKWVGPFFQSGISFFCYLFLWADNSLLSDNIPKIPLRRERLGFYTSVCEQSTVCYQTIFQKFH